MLLSMVNLPLPQLSFLVFLKDLYLLFLLYNNSVSEIHLDNGCLLLYADDILLYKKIHSQFDYSTLQQDLNKLNRWFIQNFLELNPVKCNFWRSQGNNTPHNPLAQTHPVSQMFH